MTNHVELRNVTKQFGSQKAVNQVDLVLKAGESVGMAGHNGAGKSTIMKLILGLITPTEGEVMLLGERTGSKAGALLRSQIGYLPETVALHPSLTGIETMDFYAKLKKQPLRKNRELLERVGISQAARRRVGTYSKGMRQRLALAQALLGEPKVLLFDEPTTGLDPASRQMFYEVVRELNGRGATVLLSTHALAELDGHADRIIVMKNGVKVADGSMDELHVQSGLPLTVTVVSLSSLSIFLIPLIAMLLSYDALIGEIERGTMALLLSYPISRNQILAGKFIGHLIILALATTAGYGLAGITLQLANGGFDLAAWKPFALLIVASVILGAAFLSMGYLISAKVKERGTAAGIAIGVWLFFVVIFDMALLGILVADTEQVITAPVVETILLFNPSDIYRLLNLTGYENTAMYAGMAGLSDQISLTMPVLLTAQVLWVIIPLVLAAWIFGKRQI